MATLMRCTQPTWAGNKFIAAGTILPVGHPDIVPSSFEIYDVPVPEDPDKELEALRVVAEQAGVKVDKRWKADRLREEIAAAGG